MSRDTTKILDPVGETARRLLEALRPGCVRIELAGALRRRARGARCIDFVAIPKIETWHDMRVVPTPPRVECHLLWDALDYICDQPEHEGFIKRGEVLRSFMWRLADGSGKVPVNVYTSAPEDLGIKLLCHTGPEDFWFHVVGKLYAAGFAPREGKLVRISDGHVMDASSEEIVTELARMPYREPWQREGNSRATCSW